MSSLWVVFISLANDCQITCLLGCSDQVCVGTSEGTVNVLSAKDGQLLQRLSLHSHKVSVLLELPRIIKPCVCAELPMEKEPSLKTKVTSKSSLPNLPVQNEVFTFTERSRSVSNRNKMSMKLDGSSHYGNHPLFASIGNGLANWFGNGSGTTQNLEFVTWTDDFV